MEDGHFLQGTLPTHHNGQSKRRSVGGMTGRLQRDVVYLCRPIAPSYHILPMRDGDGRVVTPNALEWGGFLTAYDSDSDQRINGGYMSCTMFSVSVVTFVIIACPYRQCMPEMNTYLYSIFQKGQMSAA